MSGINEDREGYTEKITILLTPKQKARIDKEFPAYQRGGRIRDLVLKSIHTKGDSQLTPIVDFTPLENRLDEMEETLQTLKIYLRDHIADFNALIAKAESETEE